MSQGKQKYSAKEILTMDLDGIYIGNLNTVDADLVLPEEGKYGSHFQWTSGESRFIDVDGTVSRPLHGMGNRKVVLHVKAVYEEASGEREFTAVVLQEERKTEVKEIRKVCVTCMPGERPQLPSVVIVTCTDGRCVTMPVKWEFYEPLSEKGILHIRGSVEGASGEAAAIISFDDIQKEKGPGKILSYYSVNDVQLLEGTLYYEYQQCMLEYLLHVDDDQMLYNFRRAAGLDTKGAAPMTGWDEEECKLKGHTTGHYLSGLALAWGISKDERFYSKIDYMVTELSKCQKALTETMQCKQGFLSAYSEEQFDLLEQFTRYPEIWAPYYTLDKIMSGLYDCFNIAGNKKAGVVLELMGDWVYERLSRLSKDTLDKMWSMYIAGESGGMMATMAKLYQISRKEHHLKAAGLFANEKLFYPMEQKADTLEDMHANQHIPQIIGCMELYAAAGGYRYWEIGKNFWEIVTEGHTYCNGGTGETEMFHRAGTTCSYLTDKAAESCASYNLLRLTAELFAYTLESGMMDYYDNTLRNHILTSCSHTDDGGTTYFLPLGPGENKEYSTSENTCCHGTGMESRFRYLEHIYAYDKEHVYINLLIDSVLSAGPRLKITTASDGETVQILCKEDLEKKLKIRIPAWAKESFSVYMNGEEIKKAELDRGYLCIPGACCKDDEILLKLPKKLRILENAFDEQFVNLAYGPDILAALSREKEFLVLPALEEIEPDGGASHFRAGKIKFIPFAEVNLEPYHVYFRKENDCE